MDYTLCVQNFLSNWVMAGIGYLCGGLKMFTQANLNSIRKVMFYITIPALFFREIGNAKLSKDSWISFAHAILVQLSACILSIIVGFLWPTKHRSKNIVLFILSFTQKETFFYGWAIANSLFETGYVVHSVMHGWVQFLLTLPLTSLLAYLAFPESMDPTNLDEFINPPAENPLEPKEGGEEAAELEDVDANKTSQTVDPATGNPVPASEGQSEVTESSDAHKVDEQPAEDVPVQNEEEAHGPVQKPLWKLVLFNWVTPINILAILGIIWAATPWSMIRFLDSLCTDLGKSVVGAGIFVTGCLAWSIPFKGADWKVVALGLFFHFAIMPALSVGFSYALGQTAQIARFLVFINCTPASFASLHLARELGFSTSSQSHIFLWTVILSVVFSMIWCAIITEGKFFE